MASGSSGKFRKTAKAKSTAKRTRQAADKTKTARRRSGPALLRPLWLGLGAVAGARDAVGEFLDDAIQRGEEIETRRRKRTGRTKAKSARAKKAPARATRKKATGSWFDLDGKRIGDRVRAIFDIPTKQDLASLEKKIDALAKKAAKAARAGKTGLARASRRTKPERVETPVLAETAPAEETAADFAAADFATAEFATANLATEISGPDDGDPAPAEEQPVMAAAPVPITILPTEPPPQD